LLVFTESLVLHELRQIYIVDGEIEEGKEHKHVREHHKFKPIPGAHAVVQILAVVIELLHTVVAYGAVGGESWSPDHACPAES
jgi:hypothetical protein